MKVHAMGTILVASCLFVFSASARRSGGNSGGVPFSRPSRTTTTRAMPAQPSRPAARPVTPDTTRRGSAGSFGIGRQVTPSRPATTAPRNTPTPPATRPATTTPARPAVRPATTTPARPAVRPATTTPVRTTVQPQTFQASRRSSGFGSSGAKGATRSGNQTRPSTGFRPATRPATGGSRPAVRPSGGQTAPVRPPAVRPAPPPPRGGRFLPPPRFDDRTRRRHHPRRHHYRPALHTPFFATSRHFFFNAWCWDPYGEAFVPATLNPVFDPYWGWRGVGGFWWERAYATQYAYTGTILNPATQYAYTAAIDPVTQKAVIPEPAPEDVRTPEQANDEMTDLLLPEDRASDFDDVYDDLLVESVDTTLDTRSLYTETLDPTRILQSYHGLDRETGDDRFLTDYLEEYDDENE